MREGMQRKLRRYQSLLSISGMAVIVFGLWNILKTAMGIILSPDTLLASISQTVEVLPSTTIEFIVFYGVIFVFLLIELGIRLYIGLSARADSEGKKKKSIVYIVISMIVVSANISGMACSYFTANILNMSLIIILITIVVDITSVVAFIEMIVAAITVRSVRKQLASEGK